MEWFGKWMPGGVFLSSIALLSSVTADLKAEEPTVGVDIELISSVKTVAPSSTFTVGLMIRHHPGFHTYWKNPGAVGFPIQVEWELPEGFVAFDVLWPVPQVSSMAGHPVFGYESDVMLLIDIMAPKDLPEGEIELHADVAWMACSNSCHPDSRRFSVSIPAGESQLCDDDREDLFTRAGSRIPRLLTGWQSEVMSKPDAEMIEVVLTPPDGEDIPSDLLFFSEDRQVSSDPLPTIQRSDDGTILIQLKRFKFSPKQNEFLPFVLVGDDGKWFGRLSPSYPIEE